MGKMKTILLLFVTAILTACGTAPVRFQALAAPERVPTAKLPDLHRIYMVFVLPPPAPGESFDAAPARVESNAIDETRLFESSSRPVGRAEAKLMINEALSALSTSFANVCAYQYAYSQDVPSLAESLKPASILWLTPSEVKGDRSYEDDPIYDPNGIQTGTQRVLKFQGSFSLGYRLASYPSGEKISDGDFSRVEESTESGKRTLAVWMAGKPGLVRGWKDDMKDALIPHQTERSRDLAPGQTADAKAALKAAGNDDWDQAEKLWRQEAAKPGDYSAEFNLGVAAERRGHWSEAKAHYQAALERAKGGPAEKQVRQCLGDVEGAAGLQELSVSTAAAAAWFDEPVSILPFISTPSVAAGAGIIRSKFFEQLKAKGYRVQLLTDTDRLLAAQGLKDIDAIAQRPPAELAKILSARKLVYAAVDDYSAVGDTSDGHVHVSMAARMVDADGKALWAAAGEAQRDLSAAPAPVSPGSLAAAAPPISNLNSVLSGAVSGAVQGALETLPTRIGPPPSAPPGANGVRRQINNFTPIRPPAKN